MSMRQRGFSLPEVIVVITIIGLAYVLLPKMVSKMLLFT